MGYAHGEGDVADIVNRAQAEVYGVSQAILARLHARRATCSTPSWSTSRPRPSAAGEISGVRSGLVDLDDLLHGFKGGQLIAVGARPGVGKSVFGIDVLREGCLRQGLFGAMFVMEMSKVEVGLRIVAAEAHHQPHRPAKGPQEGPRGAGKWERLAKVMGPPQRRPVRH